MLNPAYDQGSNTGIINDLLGDQSMARGGDPQDYIRQLIQELAIGRPREMMRRYDDPGEVGAPHSDSGAQDYVDQQLAGDVVPMRTHPPAISDVNMRLQSPGVGARSQGMQSIDRFKQDPRSIDLLGILNMLGQEPGR
jgi:hypothetical protein